MARRSPEADRQPVVEPINPPAREEIGGGNSNIDPPADSTGADITSNVPVGASDNVVIPTEQFQRVVRACKTRPDMLFDIALVLEGRGDDATIEETLEVYGLLPEDLDVLVDNPVTGPQVKALRDDIREHGLGFKRKAAAMAEAFLPKVATIINDEDTAPHVKLQGIGKLAQWGGLEKSALDNAGGGVTVQINFPENTQAFKVIEGEVIPDES